MCRVNWLCFLVSVVVAATTRAEDAERRPDPKTRFAAQVDARGGEVKVVTSAEGLVLEVHSPRGIGRATIARQVATWPMVSKVRLYLRGLEKFEATADGNGIDVSVSSGVEQTIRASRIVGGREGMPLEPGSDEWPATKIVAKQKRSPLRDGYFEITLPASLFQGNPRELRLQWIDFYR